MSKFSHITMYSKKSIATVSILALFLLGLTTPHAAGARPEGPSASGVFRFAGEDGLAKTIEFSARAGRDGTATGGMTFSGPVEISEQDGDGAGREGFSGSLTNLYIEATFDGLVVERNRAVMSGTVTASNLGEYIERRVLLVVEDNGAGTEDKITWGLYKPVVEGLTPTDAERRDDDGALLRWTATDAEREDDRGIPSHPSRVIDCRSFPLSSYSFDDVRSADGDIQVRP